MWSLVRYLLIKGPFYEEGRARYVACHWRQTAQLRQLPLEAGPLSAHVEALGAAADVAVVPPGCALDADLLGCNTQ